MAKEVGSEGVGMGMRMRHLGEALYGLDIAVEGSLAAS